jgi:3'(2'), 5'-bisphosphate nucleotidase
MVKSKYNIEKLIPFMQQASAKVMDVYDSAEINVEHKKDNSPLTIADKCSHEILTSGIKEVFPEIPVISEEGDNFSYEERKKWEYFWLVDPLDGTKEFISKNGEFTINAALIKINKPVAGVVCVPAKGDIYFAEKGKGAYKKDKNGKLSGISVKKNDEGAVILARSRSHRKKAEEDIVKNLGETKTVFAGSALKFLIVAEGKADLYLRCGPTMEWDTAAGHFILEEAGGILLSLENSEFLYNKRILKNPGFICGVENIVRKCFGEK